MLIGQDLLEHSSLQIWTLRFKAKRLELYYWLYALPRLKQQARIALMVGAVMYGLYGFLDVLFLPAEAVLKVWYIRSGVILLALGAFCFTFFKRFGRYSQTCLSLTGIIGGLAELTGGDDLQCRERGGLGEGVRGDRPGPLSGLREGYFDDVMPDLAVGTTLGAEDVSRLSVDCLHHWLSILDGCDAVLQHHEADRHRLAGFDLAGGGVKLDRGGTAGPSG